MIRAGSLVSLLKLTALLLLMLGRQSCDSIRPAATAEQQRQWRSDETELEQDDHSMVMMTSSSLDGRQWYGLHRQEQRKLNGHIVSEYFQCKRSCHALKRTSCGKYCKGTKHKFRKSCMSDCNRSRRAAFKSCRGECNKRKKRNNRKESDQQQEEEDEYGSGVGGGGGGGSDGNINATDAGAGLPSSSSGDEVEQDPPPEEDWRSDLIDEELDCLSNCGKTKPGPETCKLRCGGTELTKARGQCMSSCNRIRLQVFEQCQAECLGL